MAEAKTKLAWSQTAEILCILYNVNRDQKKRPQPFHAAEFNPTVRRQVQQMTPELRRAKLDTQKAAWNALKRKK